jgi:4-alpha-glucanotransferase
MISERSSGILLHPTSLPGQYGAGDFGPEAYQFVDWLASAGQSVWQVLPMGAIGEGYSPYMSSSAFAGNPLMIDLIDLGQCGWLDADDLCPDPGFQSDRVNYALQFAFRIPRLRRAALRFLADTGAADRSDFEAFCVAQKSWLDDYSMFMAIDAQYHGMTWNEWPEPLACRDPVALRRVTEAHAGEVAFWKFCQWIFARQWSRLKNHANALGIRILGDVPIYVAFHSADVWAQQSLFELDEQGWPTVVAGVPPDYFSATGQRWGNPLYRWAAHRADGYHWWVARMQRALELADVVRIDHFRGFAAYWEIPAADPSAIGGRWVAGPGKELFQALRDSFPELPVIAEDLGSITPDVEELRNAFQLPGMRILQFAFAENASHAYLPHNFAIDTVAYAGTHDNDTSIGWWNAASPRERAFAQHYLGTDGNSIQWSLIRALSVSVARMVIYPMQDVLGLDGRYRMNVPGVSEGNWEWRFSWAEVHSWQAKLLREMGAVHGRCSMSGVAIPG